MPYDEFARELAALINRTPDSLGGNRLSFTYEIPVGRFKGVTITIGIEVPADFPNTPPSGPHIKPRLLPLNPNAPSHPERVAPSPFGEEWEYWSRPFSDWAESDHSVKSYLAHIRNLFATQ